MMVPRRDGDLFYWLTEMTGNAFFWVDLARYLTGSPTTAIGASPSLARVRAKVRSSLCFADLCKRDGISCKVRLAPTEYPTNQPLAQVKRTDSIKLPQK